MWFHLAYSLGDTMIKCLIIVMAVSLAIGRFFITPRLNLPTEEGSYEAVAHLFIGGLFGAFFVDTSNKFLLLTAVALSLVEFFAFIVQRLLQKRRRV